MAKEQARIRVAYSDCLRLQQRYQVGFGNLLERSFEVAQAEERRHRRAGGGKWRMSVVDVARYFAVKWFLDVRAYAPPQDWAEVCSLRDDCRLAFGAMSQVLRGIGFDRDATEVETLRKEYADVMKYDYSSWVTR